MQHRVSLCFFSHCCAVVTRWCLISVREIGSSCNSNKTRWKNGARGKCHVFLCRLLNSNKLVKISSMIVKVMAFASVYSYRKNANDDQSYSAFLIRSTFSLPFSASFAVLLGFNRYPTGSFVRISVFRALSTSQSCVPIVTIRDSSA